MDIKLFLDYEIRSSWWAQYIWWDWGRALAGRYFAWKTKRKFDRFFDSKFDNVYNKLLKELKE